MDRFKVKVSVRVRVMLGLGILLGLLKELVFRLG